MMLLNCDAVMIEYRNRFLIEEGIIVCMAQDGSSAHGERVIILDHAL